ncbi:AAA family ATPase, partial [Acinetobacter baumannii]
IFRTIDLARELAKNGAIVGRPGVGKSHALQEYRNRSDGEAVLMTATAISGNALRDLLGELSELLGLYTTGTISNIQRQMHAYNLS